MGVGLGLSAHARSVGRSRRRDANFRGLFSEFQKLIRQKGIVLAPPTGAMTILSGLPMELRLT